MQDVDHELKSSAATTNTRREVNFISPAAEQGEN